MCTGGSVAGYRSWALPAAAGKGVEHGGLEGDPWMSSASETGGAQADGELVGMYAWYAAKGEPHYPEILRRRRDELRDGELTNAVLRNEWIEIQQVRWIVERGEGHQMCMCHGTSGSWVF